MSAVKNFILLLILCVSGSIAVELWSHRSAINASLSSVDVDLGTAIVHEDVASLEGSARTLALVSKGHIEIESESGRKFAYPSQTADNCLLSIRRTLTLFGLDVGFVTICNSFAQIFHEVLFFPRLIAIAILSLASLTLIFVAPRYFQQIAMRNLLSRAEEKFERKLGQRVSLPSSRIFRRSLTFEELFQRLYDLFEASENEKMRLQIDNARNLAVANTTQALAHDVRKPFSMFKSIIQIVEGTEDPSHVREVLNQTLPEVNQAMASVEGMIQDVLQIGAEARLVSDEVSPRALLGTAVNEIIRVYPQADVSISYRLTHEHQVVVDSTRLGRVFANILGNAIQAMHEKGEIWVQTSQKDGFVEFVLGNAGSYIPSESLPKLFDAFFTAGKKGGTGLGLAIAKKIVEAHGGTISCRSERSGEHPNGMVEFVFTLPSARSLDAFSEVELPASSKQVQEQHARLRMAAVQEGQPDTREVELVAEVERKLLAFHLEHKRFNLLVVDDEAVYRDGMRSLLARFQSLAKQVEFFTATDANEAMELARRVSPNLIIEDVDLGQSSASGLDIVRALRAEGFNGHVCVHSNRFLQEDNKAAIAAGADSVLPKPLSRVHFLKLILASLPADSKETVSTSPPELTSKKMAVALLDDSISMRMSWKMELEDECNFRAFGNTDSFLELCDKEPGYLSSLDVVITDYNFAPGDPHDGGTLARALRERGYNGLILRASGESDLGAEIEALFDGDVGKSALEWVEFEEAVSLACRKRQSV